MNSDRCDPPAARATDWRYYRLPLLLCQHRPASHRRGRPGPICPAGNKYSPILCRPARLARNSTQIPLDRLHMIIQLRSTTITGEPTTTQTACWYICQNQPTRETHWRLPPLECWWQTAMWVCWHLTIAWLAARPVCRQSNPTRDQWPWIPAIKHLSLRQLWGNIVTRSRPRHRTQHLPPPPPASSHHQPRNFLTVHTMFVCYGERY